MNCIDIKNKQFLCHNQKITIVKELQKMFGEMYLCGKKTISSDELFNITNIRIDFQMDSAEFEGLIYTIMP